MTFPPKQDLKRTFSRLSPWIVAVVILLLCLRLLIIGLFALLDS